MQWENGRIFELQKNQSGKYSEIGPRGGTLDGQIDIKVISSTKISQRSSWQLQILVMEFHNCLYSSSGYILYFDGVSKGNSGETGAGGCCMGLEESNNWISIGI
jgi:hypothetical protein